MSKATNLRLLLTAVAAAVSTSVSAQGLAQLPGATAQQPAAAGAAAAARAPAARAQGAAQPAQPLEEEIKPRNPLEEISRLNAEIATLKAKLQVTDIKAQIKKKEEELNPPPKVEKKEEPKAAKKEEPPKPNLPPLPNLNALLPPGAPVTGPASSAAAGQQQSQGQGRPAARMDPQLLAVEGVGDNLRAELMTDWGGWAEVGVGDRYYDYMVEDIKLSSIVLAKDKTRLHLAITNSRVNKLQTQAAMARNMPSSASGGVPVPMDGAAFGPSAGGGIAIGAPNGALTTTGLPVNPVGPSVVPDGVPLPLGPRPQSPSNLGVGGVKGGPPTKSPFMP